MVAMASLKRIQNWGTPGWLSEVSIQLLILTQAIISGCEIKLCWVWRLLKILSLSLCPSSTSKKNTKLGQENVELCLLKYLHMEHEVSFCTVTQVFCSNQAA